MVMVPPMIPRTRRPGTRRRNTWSDDLEDDADEDSEDRSSNSNNSQRSMHHHHYVGIRYTIARLSDDSSMISHVPESFLRKYVPYPPSTQAICDVGGYSGNMIGIGRIVPCTIVEYVRPLMEGVVNRVPTGKENVRVKMEEEV